MLSNKQIQQILKLFKNSGLKYEEVYEELLDHYALAVEDQMQKGHSFDEALQQVHQDFGKGQGLKHIEERYFKQKYRHFRQLQWQSFIGHFRWPQTIASLLIGLFIYGIANLLGDSLALFYALSIIALAPAIVGAYGFYQFRKNATYSKRTIKGTLLLHMSGLGLNFLNVLIFVPKIFFNELFEREYDIKLLALYPAAISILLTMYILFLLSFLQARKTMLPKPA